MGKEQKMDGKNSYVEDMDLAIDRYTDSPCPGSLFAVLCGLFDGIKEGAYMYYVHS